MTLAQTWPLKELPREKLLKHGAGALSDSELLAIFLRTGTTGKNVMQLSREIILHFGSLAALFGAPEAEFCGIKGLGQAKYVQLQACIEMSQRHAHEQLENRDAISNPEQVKQFVKARLRNQPNEVFAVLFLDNQHHVIAFEELFLGLLMLHLSTQESWLKEAYFITPPLLSSPIITLRALRSLVQQILTLPTP